MTTGKPWDLDALRIVCGRAQCPDWPGIAAEYNRRTGQQRHSEDVRKRANNIGLAHWDDPADGMASYPDDPDAHVIVLRVGTLRAAKKSRYDSLRAHGLDHADAIRDAWLTPRELDALFLDAHGTRDARRIAS